MRTAPSRRRTCVSRRTPHRGTRRCNPKTNAGSHGEKTPRFDGPIWTPKTGIPRAAGRRAGAYMYPLFLPYGITASYHPTSASYRCNPCTRLYSNLIQILHGAVVIYHVIYPTNLFCYPDLRCSVPQVQRAALVQCPLCIEPAGAHRPVHVSPCELSSAAAQCKPQVLGRRSTEVAAAEAPHATAR